MTDVVKMFRGTYQYLSNMHPAAVEWDGRTYRNSEAAFQSAKSLDPAIRDTFCELTGQLARRAGRKLELRSDWELVKDDVMEEIVRAKFTQHPELLKKLLATGSALLIEGNRWHDTYWGVDLDTGEGENHLGRLLMKLRSEMGGAAFLDSEAQVMAERKAERRRERDALQAEIDSVSRRIEEIESMDFTGMEVDTKAFGRVRIIRQEGSRLVFAYGGVEKKFLLPGCILKGFVKPEQPIIDSFFQAEKLREALARMQEELVRITRG